MLLPSTCPICERPGPAPCDSCAALLVPAPNLPAPPSVDVVHALLAYEDGGRELVARLKYRNARSSLRWLAARMAARVERAGTVVDVVTWVPTSKRRRYERGFDQAELLARAVARELHRPCRALLDRRPGPPQTGRTARHRWRGPELRVRPRAALPTNVLVVDDVVTTGASVAAAARTLRAGGVRFVAVVSAARTPLKRAGAGSETCM